MKFIRLAALIVALALAGSVCGQLKPSPQSSSTGRGGTANESAIVSDDLLWKTLGKTPPSSDLRRLKNQPFDLSVANISPRVRTPADVRGKVFSHATLPRKTKNSDVSFAI